MRVSKEIKAKWKNFLWYAVEEMRHETGTTKMTLMKQVNDDATSNTIAIKKPRFELSLKKVLRMAEVMGYEMQISFEELGETYKKEDVEKRLAELEEVGV